MHFRFYVAAQLASRAQAQDLIARLTAAGGEVTFDWTCFTAPSQDPEIARDEVRGVVSADFVFVLLPGGYGTHVEIGAALATGRRVILIGEPRTVPYPCIFHLHPLVVGRVATVDEAPALLQHLPPPLPPQPGRVYLRGPSVLR